MENKKIEELTDEQLKEVSGGWGICSLPPNCKTMSTTTCECQECKEGWTLKTDSAGVKTCILKTSEMVRR